MTTTQPKRQPIPFGKYLLLDRINIGGMAEVWRGKMFGAGGFERLVAIKRILPNIAEDDEFISMFIDEAKISVQLNHANIAKIEELGQIQNNYFIAMEYIPGKDMRAIFDRGRKKSEPAPVPLVAYVVSKMCEGLDYAHRKKDSMGRDLNIVHRDISPQNILVSFEGEVKVIDFGIAKAAGKATKTQAGILKGKFGYMSPEQIRGLPLDRRSDIFAIGVCLYEMLTGERLFVGDSDFSVLEKVRKAEVLPPSSYNRRIPESLEKIVLKALARDVDERYQYANELGDDLQRFLITSDSIFSRKDLMQYMKSTFAEDVEREKQRLQEYSEISAPEGLLSAIEMGFVHTPSAAAVPSVQPNVPSSPPVAGPGVRRSPTLASMPKLTATPLAPPVQPDEESGATQVVSSQDYQVESSTPPGMVGPGRTVTPMEVPRPPSIIDEHPTQRPPPPRLNPGMIPPPRSPPVLASGGAESTTVGRQGRNTMDSMPRVGRPDAPPDAMPPRASLASMPVLAPRPPPPVAPPPPEDRTDELMLAQQAAPPPSTPPALSNPTPTVPLRTPAALMRPPPPVVAREPPREPVSTRDEDSGLDDVPARSGASNRLMLFAAMGFLALMLLGVVGYMMLRSPPMGYLMVELPAALQGKARVSLNGEPLDVPKDRPLLKQVPIGQGMVMVSADGYSTFTQPVDIVQGMEPARVRPVMNREARMSQLVVVTQPANAVVKVNGTVMRKEGTKSLVGEVAAESNVEVEVSAPGFKSLKQTLHTNAAGEPTEASYHLDALEPDTFEVLVQSNPTGATIVDAGKELGLTPKTVRLSASVKQVRLTLHCHDEAVVSVGPGRNQVSGELKKQRRCK